MEIIYKAGKVVFGAAMALVTAEIITIGANAAYDDIKVVVDDIRGKMAPEPVKPKGFFGKKK